MTATKIQDGVMVTLTTQELSELMREIKEDALKSVKKPNPLELINTRLAEKISGYCYKTLKRKYENDEISRHGKGRNVRYLRSEMEELAKFKKI